MLRLLAILLVGTALGLASAAGAIWHAGNSGALSIGPWVTPLDAGGPNRGPYLRATAAVRATLALSRKEAIYFRAATDSEGNALEGACTYTITGKDLPARWWSITLYGTDHYLIANPQNRYAYASPSVAHNPDGTFTITVSPHPQPGNWLNPGETKNIVLLTRIYEPSAEAAANPAGLKLPAITRTGCG
jgi:hypothetical protein